MAGSQERFSEIGDFILVRNIESCFNIYLDITFELQGRLHTKINLLSLGVVSAKSAGIVLFDKKLGC